MKRYNVKIVNSPKVGLFHFHRWELEENCGTTRYYTCSKCGARKVTQIEGGYQPINKSWVLKESDTI